MVRFVALCCAALAGAAPLAAQACRALDSDFDRYAARAVRDWRVPGLALAVVKDGAIVFARGYGVREIGRPEPVDTSTLFAVASTTKAMTAAALGMLVDAGEVRWDDRVSQHLPAFELADPYATREVTVRDLLTHRAGLGNADWLWRRGASRAELVAALRMVPATYSLRSGFTYHNVMYVAAGEVIAAASGMSYERFIADRILRPVGMRNSYPDMQSVPAGAARAVPHFMFDSVPRAIPPLEVDQIAAAGGVWSNAADMARWIRFLLDSARVEGRALLRPETHGELFRPQTVIPTAFYPTTRLTRPSWTTYGLGWVQHDYAGRKLDFHTGTIGGMLAIVGLVQAERLGVVVLANLYGAELRHALMYRAIDACLGRPPRDWSGEVRALYTSLAASRDSSDSATTRRVSGTRPTLPLTEYAGSYADSLWGTIEVISRGDRLELRSGSAAAALDHWHYDIFRARWADPTMRRSEIHFVVGSDGRPDRLELDGTPFRRAPGR